MKQKDYYDQTYWEGDKQSLSRTERIIRKITKFSEFLKDPILDAGCGEGVISGPLAALGYKVDGCDISSLAIKKARKAHPKQRFFIHDFETSGLKQKYKTVISVEVIEHIFDYNSFLQNIRPSIEDGGHIIMTTPNVLGLRNVLNFMRGNGKLFEQLPHIRYFTPKTITSVLVKNGYRNVKVFGYSSMSFLPKTYQGNMVIIASV